MVLGISDDKGDDIMSKVTECMEELKKLHGLPPYDEPGNLLYGDGYFAQSIRGRYAKQTMDEAKSQLGIKTAPNRSVKVEPETKSTPSLLTEMKARLMDKEIKGSQQTMKEVKSVCQDNADNKISQSAKQALSDIKKPAIKKDIQKKVDKYLDLHKLYKELEHRLAALRDDIEPYMEEKGIVAIEGTNGASIEIVPQNRTTVTSVYTTYDIEGVEPLLDMKAKEQCITRVVDRDVLELLVKTNQVPRSVLNHKVTKVAYQFMVKR
jgi:hypothetical protein